MSRSRITHVESHNRRLNQGYGFHAKPAYIPPFNKGYHVQNRPITRAMNISPNSQLSVKREERDFKDFLAIAEMVGSSNLLKKVLG